MTEETSTPEQEIDEEKDQKDEEENKIVTELYKNLKELTEKLDISHAVFMAYSKDSADPYLWIKGDELSVAQLAAMFAKHVRSKIDRSLST